MKNLLRLGEAVLVDRRSAASGKAAEQIQKRLAACPHDNLLRACGDAAGPARIKRKRFPQCGFALVVAVGHDDFTPVEYIAHMTPPQAQVGVFRVGAVGAEVEPETACQRDGRGISAPRSGQGGLFSGEDKIAALRLALEISLYAQLLISRLHGCAAYAKILGEFSDGRHSLSLPELPCFHRVFEGVVQLPV